MVPISSRTEEDGERLVVLPRLDVEEAVAEAQLSKALVSHGAELQDGGFALEEAGVVAGEDEIETRGEVGREARGELGRTGHARVARRPTLELRYGLAEHLDPRLLARHARRRDLAVCAIRRGRVVVEGRGAVPL